MKPFQFGSVIDKFSVPFTFFEPQSAGYWATNGKWVEGATASRQMSGLILPVSEDDRRYVPNGVYTERDRKVITKEPLDTKGKIEHNGQRYTLQQFKDYTNYTDAHIYIARGQG